MSWMYFPINRNIPQNLKKLVKVFEKYEDSISSSAHELKSNDVLKTIRPGLEEINYEVEKDKKNKIKIPVIYGKDGKSELNFEVDARNETEKIVVEVEAGRAVVNYQFLKDFYEACCMVDVDYLCIAVRKNYKGKNDFQKVCTFFTGMYASDRFDIPLKGTLIIGY